jgi:hypothetical protein
MTITLESNGRTQTVAIRPDTAEYLMSATTVDPKDWRVKDLVIACWASAQRLKSE